MTRKTVACYVLIASAFVLGGLLTIEVADRFEPKADASLVVNKDIFTVLTTEGIRGEEFLYMLDNKNERLLCYATDPRGRIELYASLNVADWIKRGLAEWEKSTGGGRR